MTSFPSETIISAQSHPHAADCRHILPTSVPLVLHIQGEQAIHEEGGGGALLAYLPVKKILSQ